MCWTTQTPPVKHIAKEIIYVYKVIYNNTLFNPIK